MKIYKVEFEPMWPVGCCCIIAANNPMEARSLAKETITHTDEIKVKEVKIDKPVVIEYQSGNY